MNFHASSEVDRSPSAADRAEVPSSSSSREIPTSGAERQKTLSRRFEGKSVIVVGAGGGIGHATVTLLMENGAQVLAADVDGGSVQALAEALGPAVLPFVVDIREPVQVASMISEGVSRLGRLDVLINNAALQTDQQSRADQSIEDMDVEIWDAAYSVNVRGAMLACRHAIPHLVRATGGAIVNLASNLALQGGAKRVAYASSKAAVIQLTRSIAASHGKLGVRCNCVAPGLTLTDKVIGRLSADALAAIEGEALTPYLGKPADIAEAVAFLASDAARYITGQTLVVDGGASSRAPRGG